MSDSVGVHAIRFSNVSYEYMTLHEHKFIAEIEPTLNVRNALIDIHIFASVVE